MVMHWKIRGTRRKFVPTLNKFGFVYLITNKKNGKAYVGCKQYFLGKKKSNSKWETYMGSSKTLLDDIKKIGKKHFKFEVIAEYKNKRSLRYYECYFQMKYNVLSTTLEGTDEPAFYNSYVGGKWYRPVEHYVDEVE
ncbi:MAG: NAD synthetase [Sneathiella sp.]|nr:NAD synthetase [Sneathiella sp.]